MWTTGHLPFSPLASVIGSIFFVVATKRFNAFIILTHTAPLWLLRREPLDMGPNALTFLVYALFLVTQGTDPLKIYKLIVDNPPSSIREYLIQRKLMPSFLEGRRGTGGPSGTGSLERFVTDDESKVLRS